MRQLTAEWAIDLDDSFQGRVVDGDLQLLSLGPPVRTVWIGIWGSDGGSVDETAEWIRQDMNPDPVQRFDERGPDGEIRLASWYLETDGERTQWGLYAYTIRPGSHVQAAFLSDDEADLDWALHAWRSLAFGPADE